MRLLCFVPSSQAISVSVKVHARTKGKTFSPPRQPRHGRMLIFSNQFFLLLAGSQVFGSPCTDLLQLVGVPRVGKGFKVPQTLEALRPFRQEAGGSAADDIASKFSGHRPRALCWILADGRGAMMSGRRLGWEGA